MAVPRPATDESSVRVVSALRREESGATLLRGWPTMTR
jgi:hypothetical protein